VIEFVADRLTYSLFECGIQLLDGTILNKQVVCALNEEEAIKNYQSTYNIKIQEIKKDG
jgi:hypothetical protein